MNYLCIIILTVLVIVDLILFTKQKTKDKHFMAQLSDFNTKLDRIEAAVASVQDTVNNLTNELANGLPEADQTAILARMDDIAAKAEAIVSSTTTTTTATPIV